MNVDAIVKTNNADVVSPLTKVENVLDRDFISVEEHLKLIYSELDKRDIKRVYLELEDITEKEEPSTFDIVSAMADNTIAMISVPAESHLVTEIGAKTAGVLILVKKTSVYFSCGMFFTYRYGTVYYGVSGLAGNSFVWQVNTRPIHSLHSGASNTLTVTNTYEKIVNWGGIGVNPRLTINNGTITIPAGVNHIMVSAYVVFENAGEGTKYLHIFKNNETTNLMVKQKGVENITLSIPPLMIDVKEGDTIDLRVHSNSLDTLRFKHLTIEVID